MVVVVACQLTATFKYAGTYTIQGSVIDGCTMANSTAMSFTVTCDANADVRAEWSSRSEERMLWL